MPLSDNSRGSGVGEGRRPSFNSVPVLEISGKRRLISRLMIRNTLLAPDTNSLDGGKLILTSSESAEDGVEAETDEAVEPSEGTLD